MTVNVRWYGFGFSFLVLAWLLPNHYAPWQSAYQEFLGAIFLWVMCSLVLYTQVKVSPVILAFLLLVPIPLFQYWMGVVYFFGDALVSSLYLLGWVAALSAGYNFFKYPQHQAFIGVFASAFILGSIFSFWVAVRQWLMLSGSIWVADLPSGGRPFANMGQPNNLATLLCMGASGVVYFYEKRKINNLSAGVLIVIFLFGVALTGSRTPWVAAPAVFFFWYWKSYSFKFRLSPLVLFFWLTVYFAFVVIFPYLTERLLISDGDFSYRVSSFERWDIWRQLLHAVWIGPAWGYGWNQVSVAQVSVASFYPVLLMVEHSHNIVIDILLWNGPIIGGIIILVLGGWIIFIGLFVRGIEGVYCLVSSGFLIVHGMLEYPMDYSFFLFPLGLLLGAASSCCGCKHEVMVSRGVIVFLIISTFGLMCWLWKEYRVIDEDYRLMRFEIAQIGSLKSLDKSPNVVLLTQLREFIRFARTPATVGMSNDELGWMQKVAHRYPYQPSLYRYTLALALNGEFNKAADQLLMLRGFYGADAYEDAVISLRKLEVSYPQLHLLTGRLQVH
ncbi:Wzy polymerase domain-containing protein [Pseudomonas sp.]|uniref:PglL family O-oligosaccharyltransferase n=1 Tax=Pseudomonas sp. TaxID=306 RepID=UPI0028B089E8|nr:Wzy polymerase domain-containing protein [Pseudomonas sp.]